MEISNGPSTPATIRTQFNCEGTTLSGMEFELLGSGYRLSLVKRRFVSGLYLCLLCNIVFLLVFQICLNIINFDYF